MLLAKMICLELQAMLKYQKIVLLFETKFKYYASAVDKEKDYIIKTNDEEYRIDLSKTEDEYLKERLNKYNNS